MSVHDRLELAFTIRWNAQKTVHAAEQTRPDVAQARSTWRAEQPTLNPTKLVFLDETATKTNMIRACGRSERGTRLIDRTPHGNWKTSSFIAGLRANGMVAPCVFDGAITGEMFLSYIEQALVPTLAKDDIVMMDNVGCHKVAGVREAIEAVGATLRYLPAYSPDLNPIEMAFAKIKSILRAKALRAIDALWNALGDIASCISPEECSNFFRHAGYFRSG